MFVCYTCWLLVASDQDKAVDRIHDEDTTEEMQGREGQAYRTQQSKTTCPGHQRLQ